MRNLLDAVITFPGALYSVLLGVVLLYWISMLLGAVDLDLLGGAEHGGVDGAADGAMHGDGVADGHGDAGGDGHHDGGDGDVDGDADSDGGVLSALGAVGLRKLPATVSISLLVIWGWLLSVLGMLLLAEPASRAIPSWAFRALLFVVSLGASLKLASITARPIAPVFVAKGASRREHLVGKTAEVSTGRLDARFGQVLVADGGAGLLIDARHEGEVALKRGDRVVVTSWDAEKNVALVEPLDRFTALRVREAAKAAPSEGKTAESVAADDAANADDARRGRVLR